MDNKEIKKLNRRLRRINLWLSFFGVILIAILIIVSIVSYKVIVFTSEVSNKITNLNSSLSETLDIKSQLCEADGVGAILSSTLDCNR